MQTNKQTNKQKKKSREYTERNGIARRVTSFLNDLRKFRSKRDQIQSDSTGQL